MQDLITFYLRLVCRYCYWMSWITLGSVRTCRILNQLILYSLIYPYIDKNNSSHSATLPHTYPIPNQMLKVLLSHKTKKNLNKYIFLIQHNCKLEECACVYSSLWDKIPWKNWTDKYVHTFGIINEPVVHSKGYYVLSNQKGHKRV